MSKPIADQQERELLGDIVGSQGWQVFIRRIAMRYVDQRCGDVIAMTRRGDIARAQAALAAAEAAGELVRGAYEGAGIAVPKDVLALIQPGFTPNESADGGQERSL